MMWLGSEKIEIDDHVLQYTGEESAQHKNGAAIIMSKDITLAVRDEILYSE